MATKVNITCSMRSGGAGHYVHEPGSLYCITEQDRRIAKIGYSKNLPARVRALSRDLNFLTQARQCLTHLGLPADGPLVLTCAREWRPLPVSALVYEQAAHWELGRRHDLFCSGEWYAMSPDDVIAILDPVIRELIRRHRSSTHHLPRAASMEAQSHVY